MKGTYICEENLIFQADLSCHAVHYDYPDGGSVVLTPSNYHMGEVKIKELMRVATLEATYRKRYATKWGVIYCKYYLRPEDKLLY